MDKKVLFESVEKHASLLSQLSDRIWEYAELSMQEYKSAADYAAVMKELGFQVEEKLAGIPTAFSGRFGTEKPVIGILGEFDALSGLSQKADSAKKEPITADGCGHGCGHNILGAASLGAAIALKEQIEAGNLKGSVVFYGCPGEEGCAGKAFMARDGMFRDLDAALCWHPGDVNEVTVGSCAASLQVEYSFTGVASHAAGTPEMGRSALDAAELMNIGVQFLREHMPKTGSIHYSFLDAGGPSPNVVQPTAKVLYMVRGANVTAAKALLERVNKIAQGAAMMSETSVTWKQIDGTSSTLSNTIIEKLIYENLMATPLPLYSEEETAYAKALMDTYPVDELPGHVTMDNMEAYLYVAEQSENGKASLNNFVMPYIPSKQFSPGSTDVGDVSWLTPTAQFSAVTWPSGVPGHSWQIVSAGKSSIAHKGLCYAAKVLAATAADLMCDEELLSLAKKEFSVTAAAGYDCPIGKDVKIPE